MLDPASLLADPEWLAHRYVEGADAFRFVKVRRPDHAAAAFLTDEYIGAAEWGGDVDAARCLALPDPGGLHFLFHSAFCASTLLARAFDQPGAAIGLSEPMVLNDVVGLWRRGAGPQAVARMADAATRLLGRPFGLGEAVIVKPSNVINPLAQLLLGLCPQARAILLYAPLETFLVSVARKGLHCRIWVRQLLAGYLREGVIEQLGMTSEDVFQQSDLQVAAVGWLAQHRLFGALADRFGARVAMLDADRMLADPAAGLAAAARHYGVPLDVAQAVDGPAFSRHSKSGAAYSARARADDYARVRDAHGEEIGMVVAWARSVADRAEITLDPIGSALLA